MARRGFSTAQSGGDEDDVNVTPLLDIVFIMLIFFIVTSTFVKEPGEEITRPGALNAIDQTPQILVAVNASNEIFVNKRQVELNEVKISVEQLLRENPKADSAVIQADEKSETRYLVEVLEQIQAAGVGKVAVATDEEL